MTFDSTILVYLLGIPGVLVGTAVAVVWNNPKAHPKIVGPILMGLTTWGLSATLIALIAVLASYYGVFRPYIDPTKLKIADEALSQLMSFLLVGGFVTLMLLVFDVLLGKLARHKIELDASIAQPHSPP